MVSGKHKSRRFRRIYTRVPSGKTIVVYKPRKPSRAICGNCKGILHGFPSVRQTGYSRLSKSQRKSERPYSNLCSKCSRLEIIARHTKV